MRPTVALAVISLLTACDPTAGGWAPPEVPLPTPEGLIDASDPQAITDIVARRDTGYWRRDNLRDPIIFAETAGVPWKVEFYGCEEGRDCTDLRFFAVFEPGEEAFDADDIADWNRTHRFGTALITDDDAAEIEMSVTLAGGVTRQNFDQTLDWWLLSLAGFSDEFGG